MLHYEGAEQLLLKSLFLFESIHGKNHESVAKIYFLLAQLFWNQGKWDQAEPYCLNSLLIREIILGKNHPKVAKCLCGLGEMFIERDPVKAKPLLIRSLEIFQSNVSYLLYFFFQFFFTNFNLFHFIKFGRENHLVSRLLHDLATISDINGINSILSLFFFFF